MYSILYGDNVYACIFHICILRIHGGRFNTTMDGEPFFMEDSMKNIQRSLGSVNDGFEPLGQVGQT